MRTAKERKMIMKEGRETIRVRNKKENGNKKETNRKV